jgi:uncharacterized protein (DUF4213/DUF364 family)
MVAIRFFMYFWIQIFAMKDPVLVLYEDFPYDPEKILASSCGDAYVAIMLANGHIGLCSTLNIPVKTDPMLLIKPDLKLLDHRILVTAYANAQINYRQEYSVSGDIFDQIDFKKKKHTVMIGYFPPLVEKFRKDGLSLTSFDQQSVYPDLAPISQLGEKLSQSDCVIITATTLINSTIEEVLLQIKPGSAIFLLGPSTSLYPAIKEQYNITSLFGMIFKPYDFDLLEIISKGMGTRSFSKKGKKVSL